MYVIPPSVRLIIFQNCCEKGDIDSRVQSFCPFILHRRGQRRWQCENYFCIVFTDMKWKMWEGYYDNKFKLSRSLNHLHPGILIQRSRKHCLEKLLRIRQMRERWKLSTWCLNNSIQNENRKEAVLARDRE